jgi:predicted phosphoadenosine phosphosulfate sulfurtransferase
MPRAKKYLDIDVVEAAEQRLDHIHDLFDSTCVMFSGGKDSLVCLEMMKRYHEYHDLGPVTVAFRDEEFINPSVIDFVKEYMDKDWTDLYWFALPLRNQKWVLGGKEQITEWDHEREWVRERPEWAITPEDVGLAPGEVTSQHEVDDIIAQHIGLKGKIAFITGVRAAESLIRFRSVTQKLNENYIGAIEGNAKSRVKLCKPIYDWSQNDVLKWLYENDVKWCEVYDWQNLTHTPLRVSTPMHVTGAKQFHKLAATEPEFYQRIVDVFPDMRDQERYYQEFDRDGILAPYRNDGWMGVLRYINDHSKTPAAKQTAMDAYRLWRGRHERDPENYPIDDLLKHIAFGTTKRRLAGRYVNSKAERQKNARSD